MPPSACAAFHPDDRPCSYAHGSMAPRQLWPPPTWSCMASAATSGVTRGLRRGSSQAALLVHISAASLPAAPPAALAAAAGGSSTAASASCFTSAAQASSRPAAQGGHRVSRSAGHAVRSEHVTSQPQSRAAATHYGHGSKGAAPACSHTGGVHAAAAHVHARTALQRIGSTIRPCSTSCAAGTHQPSPPPPRCQPPPA